MSDKWPGMEIAGAPTAADEFPGEEITAGGGQSMDVYTTPVGTTEIPAGQPGDPYGEQPQEEPSFLDQAKSGVGMGIRSDLRGLANMADLVTLPLSVIYKMLGIELPSYRDIADQGSDAMGLDTPQTNAQKFIGALTEGAVGGVATAGIGGALSGVGGVTGAAGRTLASRPGLDAFSSATGSGAAEATRQAGGGPVAQLIAGLAGGAGGALAPSTASRAGRGVVNLTRSAMDTLTDVGAERRAGNILRDSITTSPRAVVEAISEAPRSEIPGVTPTLAEVANDPGLAGFQRGHANTNPNTAAALGEQSAANALARTRAASGAMGDGSPQAIQDMGAAQLSAAEKATAAQQSERQAAIDARLAQNIAETGAQTVGARQALAAQIDRLGAPSNRDVSGAEARASFERAYDVAKDRTRQAYGAPDLQTAQPIKIPRSFFLKFKKAADDFYGDGGGEMPAAIRSIISDVAEDQTTTRTLTNIDRRLADFAGEARQNGRRSEAAFAERIRDDLGQVANENAPEAYRKALRSAKEARAEQGRVFETGPLSSTMTRDRFGNPTVGDTSVPGRLVRPGAPGGDLADSLIAAVGPQNAEQIVRQEIRRVAEEGVTTADQARAVSARYAEAARRFPSIQNDLRQLELRGAELDASRAAEKGAINAKATPEEISAVKERHAFHDAILGTPLARVADPNVDPTSFIGGLLRRDDKGRQLRSLYSQIKDNPDAVGGFRRSLGEYIVEAGAGNNFTAAGDRIPSINNTRKAISTVVTRAGDLLTPAQKTVLWRVNRQLEKANFAATASKPAGSETELNRSFKGMLQFIPGSGVVKNVFTRVVETLSNSEDVKKLLTQAILDPDFAATLLKHPTPQRMLRVANDLDAARAPIVTSVLTAANPQRTVADILQQRLSTGAAGQPLAAEEPEQ